MDVLYQIFSKHGLRSGSLPAATRLQHILADAATRRLPSGKVQCIYSAWNPRPSGVLTRITTGTERPRVVWIESQDLNIENVSNPNNETLRIIHDFYTSKEVKEAVQEYIKLATKLEDLLDRCRKL